MPYAYVSDLKLNAIFNNTFRMFTRMPISIYAKFVLKFSRPSTNSICIAWQIIRQTGNGKYSDAVNAGHGKSLNMHWELMNEIQILF